MYNNRILTFLFFLVPILGFSQNCEHILKGSVTDVGVGTPLEFVNVFIEGTDKGALTDSLGFFQLEGVCEGEFHLVFSHIGCESQHIFITVPQDTSLRIVMGHSVNLLDGIVVTSKVTSTTTQNEQAINEQSITDNASQNLSNMLETMAGVTSLKNGNGIAKPVVHGLYGNRLTILNNGVAQSGQQWGNDHSPEIDPLVANKIKVVKGVSTLEYPGANLGSIVLVEPKKIAKEPHLHGKTSYFFESNGLSHGVNLQLQQYPASLAWKINGTIKKSGDRRTASYYLRNTGTQEANLALQLEKAFSEKFFTEFYASTFNSELGVLRGSHIGNLTDLETAFTLEEPLYTEDKFKYSIEAPKQRVHHHLLKAKAKYFLKENQWMTFTAAGQLNIRKEFDVRRSGRTDIPALSLQQFTYFLETKYQNNLKKNWRLNTGIQINLIDNTNNPETGILPLIPDYYAYETGGYLIVTKQLEKWLFELGVRYDNVIQKVVAISNTLPREIIRYDNFFHNYSGSTGINFRPSKLFNLSFNLGYATRNPAINELFSGGLHQGVSGIEEGNIALETEQSIKTTLGWKGKIGKVVSFESLFYYQNIQNFIFLNPQDEIRLTIRGAFPVFRYEQTNAQLYGLDFSSQFQLTKSFGTKVVYSYIKADDFTNDVPLINMPSNNIFASISYEIPSSISLGETQLENLGFEVNGQYVFQQNHLLPEQDFTEAPAAYYLLGAKIAADFQFDKTRMRLVAKVDNALNTSYRDYLNRLRYFADDLGLNASLGVTLKF